MKRSSLTRKSGLRSGATAKVRRQNRARRKPRKYPTAAQLKARREWLAQFSECWLCGVRQELCCHEIVRRSQAPGRWCDVSNFMAVGRWCDCHAEKLANVTVAPYAWQLAIKYQHDEAYDLKAWNEVRNSNGAPVTQFDVDEALFKMVG